MNKVLASEAGFLGVNVDSNFDLAYLKTEVADKIREGDETAILKLINIARHSEDESIRDYANIIENLYKEKIEGYNHTPVSDSTPESEGDDAEGTDGTGDTEDGGETISD